MSAAMRVCAILKNTHVDFERVHPGTAVCRGKMARLYLDYLRAFRRQSEAFHEGPESLPEKRDICLFLITYSSVAVPLSYRNLAETLSCLFCTSTYKIKVVRNLGCKMSFSCTTEMSRTIQQFLSFVLDQGVNQQPFAIT